MELRDIETPGRFFRRKFVPQKICNAENLYGLVFAENLYDSVFAENLYGTFFAENLYNSIFAENLYG